MMRHTLDGPDNLTDEFVVAYRNHEIPFSNWSAHQIRLWGKTFATAEHAYQYKKFVKPYPELAERIRAATSPWQARELSRQKTINSAAWDARREAVMYEVLAAKVAQHPDVEEALRATASAAIIERDTEGDEFWGIGPSGKGLNTLGKIWMKIRSEL